ncbi:MAG: polyprenol phosphomannose-dependent alpha 1,6 mannosyltransferase MptB [Dehalococcoidia bacterium]
MLLTGLLVALWLTQVTVPLRLDRTPPSLSANLAATYGLSLTGLARYVAVMAAASALYVAGVWAARRQEWRWCGGMRGQASTLALATAPALALLPAHPAYSWDLFHYVGTARVLVAHGANPHLAPPLAFATDPLMSLSDWGWLPSPYGPLWTWVSAAVVVPVMHLGATSQVIALKSLAVLACVATVWVGGDAAERLRPGWRAAATLLVAWNPLVLLHLAADGHNDAVMLCLMAAGMWALVRGWDAGGIWALAAACLVKPAAGAALVLAAVWLWRRGRRRAVAAGAAGALALTVAGYAPLWSGVATLRATLGEGGYATTSVYAAALPLVGMLIGDTAARTALLLAPRLLFLVALVEFGVHIRGSAADLTWTVTAAYLALITVGLPWVMPWYALWPLVLAAMIPWQRSAAWPALGLSLGALLMPVATAFLAPMSGQWGAWPPLHLIATVMTLTPMSMAVFAAWWTRRRIDPQRAR